MTTEFDFTLPGLGRPESSRPKRVAEAIRNELSVLLVHKVRDPLLQQVSVVNVVMSPDLKRAKVYYVVPKGVHGGKAGKGLERARGFLRSQLATSLNLKYTPDLVFFLDTQHEENERLEEVFRQLAQEKKTDEGSV